MLRFVSLAAIHVWLVGNGPLSAQPPAPANQPSVADDLKTLVGTWRTARGTPSTLECTIEKLPAGLRFEGGAAFKYQGKPGDTWCSSVPFQMKIEDGKRCLIFDPAITAVSNLPQVWSYQFDGKALLLSARDGKYKGEYRLERAALAQDQDGEKDRAELPGAKGPLWQSVAKSGPRVTGADVSGGVGMPNSFKPPKARTLPAGVKKLTFALAFDKKPVLAALTIEVSNQAGAVPTTQSPNVAFVEDLQTGASSLFLSVEAKGNRFDNGAHQAKIKLGDEIVALMNWDIGSPSARPAAKDAPTPAKPGTGDEERAAELLKSAQDVSKSSPALARSL